MKSESSIRQSIVPTEKRAGGISPSRAYSGDMSGSGRVRILRREPVADARGAEGSLVRQQLQGHVLHVMSAEGPASTMNVDVDTDRLAVGTDDSHLDWAAAAGYLDVSRLLQEDWRGKDPLSFSPCLPCDLRRELVHRGLGGDKGFELCVERPSLVYVVLLDVGRGRTNRGHWSSV